jgi:predicted nucleic acid-binding protein
MLVTVDTSVIIAIIFNEPHKDELIGLTRGKELIAPESLMSEMGNALSAMLRRDRISLDDALGAFTVFQQIPVRTIPIDMKSVLTIVSEHRIYAYDAYMIWCAIQTGSALVSLDEQMIRIAKKKNIDILEVTT